MPRNWLHVSGCRSGGGCVFYQDGNIGVASLTRVVRGVRYFPERPA
jgi:hypothetical protein